ncbi:GlxA family transcriptional regulator [Massilia endophytica]|uniref:GlxA family transcriptional regulator n=1 Tax=Massilia endophytica TaxID=2899220 RepID=UPI001E2C7344|nr:helix-turn-helix domain-containing protein [Massilia endophytica]UGQ44818.1 helix-turn-helix domain-containing protein [Massilia endophytica]
MASKPFRVALLLYPGCMPAGLFAFADLLHAANRRSGKPVFEPVFAGLQEGLVECAHGQALRAASAIREAAPDAVLVPGFWGESTRQVEVAVAQNSALIRALAELPRAVGIWSYCTGVCIAAATGRMNGQAATVTWWLADLARLRFPKVRWQTESTDVWHERNASASGVNGYLPIAQAAIEKRLNADAYRELAKLMVLPRPERRHHAFRTMNLIEQPNRLLRQLHAVAERLPASDLTLKRLAQELNTTERTLARKVAAATGQPVASYVRCLKLNQVSERLIHTSLPASSISAELGFSSDSGMRRMFKELTSLTPAQYRQAFGQA